jgi:hypothetical protein
MRESPRRRGTTLAEPIRGVLVVGRSRPGSRTSTVQATAALSGSLRVVTLRARSRPIVRWLGACSREREW